MKTLIIGIFTVLITIMSIFIILNKPINSKEFPKQEILPIPFTNEKPVKVTPASRSISLKNLIVFRGLNGALEETTVRKWSKEKNYIIKIFHHSELDKAISYVLSLSDRRHVEVLGFSKGAETAYALARDVDEVVFRRLITVGTYHTVTTSFSTGRRPPLPNVRKHWNFVEKHQQPKGFKTNTINVSLGVVSHFKSLSKALELMDNNRKYNP